MIFGNYGTPSISRQRLRLEIWNLACILIARGPIVKNENFGKKGLPGGHVTTFGNYRTPSISRQRLRLKIRHLACRLIARCPIVKNENFGKKRSPGGHMTIFANYWTPSISLQRLKLEIRNLTWRLIARCPIVKKWTFGSTWVTTGSRDHFGELWDPLHISATAEAINSKYGTQIDREAPYRKKIKISVKRGHQGVTWPFLGIMGPPPYLGNGWS